MIESKDIFFGIYWVNALRFNFIHNHCIFVAKYIVQNQFAYVMQERRRSSYVRIYVYFFLR